MDGETLLFGSMPWTKAGFAAGGEVLLEARGGRELIAIRHAFVHDWENGHGVEPPSGLKRLAAEVAPAMSELNRVVRAFSPASPINALMGMQVGVMKVPGGKWKLVAEAVR
ncbi:hypothetical protein D3C72_2152200 [compost metagenome]